MEYHDTEKAKAVASRVEAFMDEVVIPREREALATGEPITTDEIEDLWEQAKARDLFAPQVPEEYGGQGLGFRDMLPSFEQVGRSLIGALAIRANAPQEGNMHTLEMVGTDEQKEKWLRPLVQGELTSAFAMTEPRQGGGSDPKMLQSTAVKDGDEWVINAHKWWTSDGLEADFYLVMARTDVEAHPYAGTSIILVPREADGVEVVRNVPHLGGHGITERTGGHAEVKFENVRVPVENTIGEENAGFRIAQLRLGGGRLTHCMRYSGMAQRSLEVAKAYLTEREGFGDSLAEKQALRHRIADAETRLHAARCMVRHAARELDESDARIEVAMAKMYTANVTNDAIDLALQCCGGNGIGKDLPVAHFYEHVRAFRLVDGADEVHRRTIARWAFDDVDTSEVENALEFDEELRIDALER
ncbi:acyl-CoA dehydrogenase family protein [Natrarchaeobaculum sulfurireducens]|uniref:Acyl-CoA dehydrogenase n=1 Tax=Natrarchaeobaculum sulfurireducens TaxID=2044521 RepID=A0A346PNZ6_9EURY|nr:acyl-CoA dehydrogenase family protein [Natrarchaeobaculum sulfurireducens]AXR78707.1 Acyl-CoA dehydrogenase [Natrarchaeobaculum sulfurireducens]AXR81241.1 Butyryl-CoA dehydrogenase [Natrarchaeobaculum sulfurireducens]